MHAGPVRSAVDAAACGDGQTVRLSRVPASPTGSGRSARQRPLVAVITPASADGLAATPGPIRQRRFRRRIVQPEEDAILESFIEVRRGRRRGAALASAGDDHLWSRRHGKTRAAGRDHKTNVEIRGRGRRHHHRCLPGLDPRVSDERYGSAIDTRVTGFRHACPWCQIIAITCWWRGVMPRTVGGAG